MKNNKKILSVIAALALSSTMVVGATALSGCDNKTTDTDTTPTTNATTIRTALGDTVYDSTGGNTYYASPEATTDGTGTEAAPYNLYTVLTSTTILKAGDTLLLLPGESGVYEVSNVLTMTVSGEYNKYIRVMNSTLVDEDETNDMEIVIDFSGQAFASANRGVQIYGSYVYWYGIDICGAGDNGMYIGGSYNTIEYCDFYYNRDTGLQIGRAYSELTTIDRWPSYNLVLNCTSHNNYDNETYGENADGFAAKLTVGYGNVFDGCIAYRNSDDGWDLFAKSDSGNIGTVILYNCIAFENGYLECTQEEYHQTFPRYNTNYNETNTNSFVTRDGDGNGYKLGGSVMEGDSVLVNCLTFNNRMHGVTDNSNPGVITLDGLTSYNNSAAIDNDPASPTFGQIVNRANHDSHGNVDVSRQTYSYNNLSGVLSVKSAMALSLSSDAYRGSVANSLLLGSGTQTYKVTDYIDADSKGGIAGTAVDAAAALTADQIFTQLPIVVNADGTLTYNLTGLEDLSNSDGKVHVKYRNADGSINFGDILDVKAENILGNDSVIGSDLNKTSYADYPHFYTLEADGSASSDAAIVTKVKEALIIPTDSDAVFQDFMLPATMSSIFIANVEVSQTITPVKIAWSSSNADVVSVDMTVINDDSLSGSTYYTAIVNRAAEDTSVTLTATLTYGTATQTKTFTLNVKAATPTIGEISLVSTDGELINDGGSIIVDRFDSYTLPTIVVENGMDYNGKLLDESAYDIKLTYMYGETSTSHQVEVKGFTPSNAGVYEITYQVKLKTDEVYTTDNSITITVYVASTEAEVEFDGAASVVVNKDGFMIGGDLSSATGYLYVVTSATELTDLTAENIAANANVNVQEFRATSISCQYENANTDAYYIYYALGNLAGEVTSELYSQAISVVEIDTAEKFNIMANGTAISGEATASTIYKLTADLDLTGHAWTVGSTAFRGLFNGMGYTVSNLTHSAATSAIFYQVDGGTIMNVKFHEISLTSTAQKTGIVRECVGGYFYNIAITNLSITAAAQRVGGLIGSVVQSNSPIYIEQVSLVNDAEHSITVSANRAGGIVGFIQPSSSASLNTIIDVNISNCYVRTEISVTSEGGSIVGTYHANGMARLIPVSLKIDNCIADGRITSTSGTARIGGIIGYHTGSGDATLRNCLSLVYLNFGGVDLTSSVKNASSIFGGYDTSATVIASNLFGTMEEHNADYNVSALTRNYHVLRLVTYFDNEFYLNLDKTRWTPVLNPDKEDEVVAPFVTLNFLDVA